MLKATLLALTLCAPMIAQGSAPQTSTSTLPVQAKEFFVDVGNGKLFCRVMGQGSPIVVLHGGPGMSQEYLLPHLNKLAEKHQVLFYDQRGSGQSTGEISPNTITMQAYIDDLDKIRRAMGYKKITLVGHSFGGFLAMDYATQHPEFVEKLVLMNSMAPNSKEFSIFVQEGERRMGPSMQEIKTLQESKAFREGDTETNAKYIRLMLRTYCHNPAKADKMNFNLAPRAARNGFKTSELFGKSLLSQPFDISNKLPKITCPVLILHGDTDPLPVTLATKLQKRFSNAKLVVLKECGHFAFIEQPDDCFKNINKFLDK